MKLKARCLSSKDKIEAVNLISESGKYKELDTFISKKSNLRKNLICRSTLLGEIVSFEVIDSKNVWCISESGYDIINLNPKHTPNTRIYPYEFIIQTKPLIHTLDKPNFTKIAEEIIEKENEVWKLLNKKIKKPYLGIATFRYKPTPVKDTNNTFTFFIEQLSITIFK